MNRFEGLSYKDYKKLRDRGEFDDYEYQRANLQPLNTDEETRRRYQEYVSQVMDSSKQSELVNNQMNQTVNNVAQNNNNRLIELENKKNATNEQEILSGLTSNQIEDLNKVNKLSNTQYGTTAQAYNHMKDNIAKQNGWNEETYKKYLDAARTVSQKDEGLLGIDEKGNDETLEYASLKIDSLNDDEKAAVNLIKQGYDKINSSAFGFDGDRDVKSGLNALKELGFDDAKAKEYAQYARRLSNGNKLEEDKQKYTINETDSTSDKIKKGVLNSASSLLRFPVAGIESVVGRLKEENADGLGRDVSSALNRDSMLSEYAQQQTSDAIKNPVARFGYNVGMSALQSMEMAALGGSVVSGASNYGKVAELGAKGLAMLPFGASAYNSAYNEAKQRGATNSDAERIGVTSGIIEAVTEGLSLDHLWDMAVNKGAKYTKNFLVSWLAHSGIEGSEEIAADILNGLADYYFVGDEGKSKQQISMENYMNNPENPMTEDQARSQVTKDFIIDTLLSGLAGTLAGGISGAGALAYGFINSNRNTHRNEVIKNYYGEQSQNEGVDQELYKKYANNPTQYIADNMDTTTEEGKKRQADVQELAKKEAKNGKLSKTERAYVEESYAIAQEEGKKAGSTAQQKYMGYVDEIKNVPTEYRTARDITEEDATKRLQNAAANGDVVEMGKVYNAMKTAANQDVRNNADEIFNRFVGEAQNNGVTAEQIEIYKKSAQDMYLEGVKGTEKETLGDLSPQAQEAYDQGRVQYLASKERNTITTSMADAQLETQSGNTVVFKGFNEDGTIKTADGSIKVEDLKLVSARERLVYATTGMISTESKNAMVNNIKKGDSVANYSNAFQLAYNAALTGADYNNIKKSANVLLNLTEGQMKAAYNAAKMDLENTENNDIIEEFNKISNATKGTGVFLNDGNVLKNKAQQSMAKMIAGATGLNIIVTNDTNKLEAGKNGTFKIGTSTITVSPEKFHTIFHELSEFSETYNGEGYNKFKREFATFLSDELGIESVVKIAKGYGTTYAAAGEKSSIKEMSGEMLNDAIPAILSSEYGSKRFMEWVMDNYEGEDQKTLIDKAKSLIKMIADALRKLVKNANLNPMQKRVLESEADKLNKLADSFIETLNAAAENYKNTEFKNRGIVAEEGKASVETALEAVGLNLGINGQRFYAYDDNGKEITEITPQMIADSPWGAVIQSAVDNNSITGAEAEKQRNTLSEFLTQMLKVQDMQMLWAINGTIGFQPVGAIEYTPNTKHSKTAALTSNSDPQYGTTVDFGTICLKTQAIIDAMSEIMKQRKKGLTREEIIDVVYKNTQKVGEPVPCPVCYVFSRWVGLGGLFDNMWKYQNEYGTMSDKEVRTKLAEIDSLIKPYLEGGKSPGKARDALFKSLTKEFTQLESKEANEKITAEEKKRFKEVKKQLDMLNAYTWIKDVRLSKNYNPVPAEILFDINAGKVFADEYPESWKYRTTRGSGMGKAATPYVDEHIGQVITGVGTPTMINKKTLGEVEKNPFLYENVNGKYQLIKDGELRKGAKAKLKTARDKQRVQNLLNGNRYQSTSDFRFEYGLDYLMTFFEQQAIGAKVQLYTKVPESVAMFASINAEVNCSIMPLGDGYKVNDDGSIELQFSNVTGMNWEDAYNLSRKYDNVQPILVGINNTQIRAAIESDWITFVIPYHASGSTEDRYKSMMDAVGEEVTGRTDYTDYQSDVVVDSEKNGIRAFRKRILGGKAKNLTSYEKKILSDNPMLNDLYQRFYVEGVDPNCYEAWITGKRADMVMPYEFWDATSTYDNADVNTERFEKYLDMLGMKPRFSGWNKEGKYNANYDLLHKEGSNEYQPGYWKMIPDRSMYNLDGSFHEQKAINVTNFNGDYLDKSLMDKEVVQPSQPNNKENTDKIVKMSMEDLGTIASANDDIKDSIEVTDIDKINELESGKKFTTYRAFQIINGGLYSPKVSKEKKIDPKTGKIVSKLGYESKLGHWEETTEARDIAELNFNKGKKGRNPDGKEYAKFDLDTINDVAYNPYLHSSNLVLNDQFSGAYNQKIVVVECEVPVSEDNGTYWADYAKDPTGWADWKPGAVAGQIAKVKPQFQRKVFLSRWMKPIRVLSDEEVAQKYKEYLEGTNIAVPWNVVTPELRHELERIGVPIKYGKAYGTNMQFEKAFPDEKHSISVDSLGKELEKRNVEINYGYQGSVKASFKDKFPDEKYSISDLELEDFMDDWMFSVDDILSELKNNSSGKKERKEYVKHLTKAALGTEFKAVDGKKIAFTEDRIEKLLKSYASTNEDYAQAYLTYMSPSQFLLLTANGNNGTETLNRIKEQSTPLDMDELIRQMDYQPIFLDIKLKGIGGYKKNEISGHEGRHRMYALQVAGYTKIPVLVFNYQNKYSKKPIENIDVYPQDFTGDSNYNKNNKVSLENLQPLSRGNVENIRNMFGDGTDADVRFSLNVDLATEFVDIAQDFDWYNTYDEVGAETEVSNEIDKIANDIANGKINYILDTLEDIIYDDDYSMVRDRAKKLYEQLKDEKHSIDIDEDLLNLLEEERNSKAHILEEGMKALANQKVDKQKINSIAMRLKHEMGSSYNVKDLADNLEKAFAYMQQNEHVDYYSMMGILEDIARPVVDAVVEKEGEDFYKQFTKAFKGYKFRLTDAQKKEVISAFGSYGNYCKTMMPITISDNATMTLDEQWTEIAANSYGLLDATETETNQPLALSDALDSARPTPVNGFAGNEEDVAKDLAMRIVEEYVGGKAAEKMKKKSAEIRNNLRKQYAERYEKYKNTTNAKLRAKNQEKAMKAAERAKTREYKNKIASNVNTLYRWISNPTDKQHVPEGFVEQVLNFLYGIDFVEPNVRYVDGKYTIKAYNSDYKKFVKLESDSREGVLTQFYDMINDGSASKSNMKWSEKMRGIQDLYNKVKNGDQFESSNLDVFHHTLDEDLADELTKVLSKGSKVSINELGSEDLRTIDNVLKNLMSAINKGNKMFTINAEINDMARDTIAFGDGKEIKSMYKVLRSAKDLMHLDMLTPRTFLNLLGESGKKLYKSLRDGLNVKISDIKEAGDWMRQTTKDLGISQKDVRAWENDTVQYKTIDGTMTITYAQIMGLYETMKREGSSDRMVGGIIPGEIKQKLKPSIRQSTAHHLSQVDKVNLINMLSDKQKAFADRMQQYMAVDCGNKGNTVSSKLFGYKKYIDPTYYPYSTSKVTIAATDANMKTASLNGNPGFSHALVQNATNPLTINSIFDVFTDHVAEMANYHGYKAATKDLLRWNNYRDTSTINKNGEPVWKTVQDSVDKIMGSSNAHSYIPQLILDLNGIKEGRRVADLASAITGNAKAAAVLGNLRVVAQQPPAYFRALATIDPKYLFTVNIPKAIKNYEENQPLIAWWKSQGYFETSVGQSIKSIVTGQTDLRDKINDKAGWAAGKADDITWAILYQAVENEQRGKLGNLSEEEFRKAVNERFDEVIDMTQVVDSTLHRSAYMRSNDGLHKFQTAFMAEPTKSYNMLYEGAVLDVRNGDKTFRNLRKRTIAWAIASIGTSAAAAVIDALRYTKDDEDWKEIFRENFVSNNWDNLNPFNMIPWVKDAVAPISAMISGEKYYSASRMDLDGITSLLETVGKFADSEQRQKIISSKTPHAIGMMLAKPVSQVTGVPIYAVSRDLVGIYNALFEDIKTNVSTVKDNLLKAVRDDENVETAIQEYGKEKDLKNAKSALTSEYKDKYVEAVKAKDYNTANEIQRKVAQAKSIIDKETNLKIPKKYNGDYYKYEIDQIKKWIDE